MSDSEELNRLRADLKALDEIRARYDKDADFTTLVNNMRYRIEAEADPWREAKQFASAYRDPKGSSYLQKLIAHYDHLAAEVARLTERVAELEDVKPIADMQPPFEGPIVGFDPVLEPNRVLATAVELGWGPTVYAEMTLSRDAKPYPLKKGGSDAK